jgi:hypothetical protein
VRELNPTLPPALAELVMQLLSKDPAGRPASAREVADRLRTLEQQPEQSADSLQTEVLPPARAGDRRHRLLVAAVALAVLLPLGYYGGTVLRIVTNKGELVVAVDDPTVEVVVKMNGVVVQDRTTKREFTLTAGDGGEVEVYEKDGIKLATKKFTLTRGGKEIVNVWQELAEAKQPPASLQSRDRQGAGRSRQPTRIDGLRSGCCQLGARSEFGRSISIETSLSPRICPRACSSW